MITFSAKVTFFFSYAFFHATRKTFSNVKETISEEWTPSFHNESVQELKPDNVSDHTICTSILLLRGVEGSSSSDK